MKQLSEANARTLGSTSHALNEAKNFTEDMLGMIEETGVDFDYDFLELKNAFTEVEIALGKYAALVREQLKPYGVGQ